MSQHEHVEPATLELTNGCSRLQQPPILPLSHLSGRILTGVYDASTDTLGWKAMRWGMDATGKHAKLPNNLKDLVASYVEQLNTSFSKVSLTLYFLCDSELSYLIVDYNISLLITLQTAEPTALTLFATAGTCAQRAWGFTDGTLRPSAARAGGCHVVG